MSSAGLPGLNGFVGEFMILLGTYEASPVFAIVATAKPRANVTLIVDIKHPLPNGQGVLCYTVYSRLSAYP